MTDAAPKRIFASMTTAHQRQGKWECVPFEIDPDSPEYILASEHAALIREAEACGMERAAARARVYASNYEQSSDGRNTFILLAEWADAEAAAIRAAKATP